MKLIKVIPAMLLTTLLLIPNVVYATTDVGWPVDTTNVQAEEIVTTDPEAAPVTTTETVPTTTSGGSLSAIDDGTTGVQDYTIFGEEYDLVNRLSSGTTQGSTLDQSAQIYSNYSDVVPTVTTDQMVSWILKKGNELISILQIFAQPFAIIIFIISCAICLIGSLSKGNMAGKGLIGMVASAILYAAALYAPLIVNIVVGWAAS